MGCLFHFDGRVRHTGLPGTSESQVQLLQANLNTVIRACVAVMDLLVLRVATVRSQSLPQTPAHGALHRGACCHWPARQHIQKVYTEPPGFLPWRRPDHDLLPEFVSLLLPVHSKGAFRTQPGQPNGAWCIFMPSRPCRCMQTALA